MNNVGDIKTFILNGNTPTQPMRYVWKWWDGSVDVTTSGTVSKELNMGGNPADAYQVRYSCEAVNERGQSAVYSGALVVNNPPSIMPGSTSLSQNGLDFSFRTRASLVAYDLEEHALGFNWYADGTLLGVGSSSYYGMIAGTYAGTYSHRIGGTYAYIDYDATSNVELACEINDSQSGSTEIVIPVFGQSPAAQYTAPQAVAYRATIDAAYEPLVRIGVNQSAEFMVYTRANSNPTNFMWIFHGTNGWAATTYSSGTTSVLDDGAYKNIVLKPTITEAEGAKIAECQIVDQATGLSTQVFIPVFLEANESPSIVTHSISPSSPSNGDVMMFEVTATDPEADLIHFEWYFPDLGVWRYGRKVFVEAAGISPGSVLHATVTITDRMGAVVTENFESDPFS